MIVEATNPQCHKKLVQYICCSNLHDMKLTLIFFFCCAYMQALNDWHLALGVMILVLVDLTILKIYTLVERFQGNLSAIRVPNRENPRDELGVGWSM